MSVQKAVDFFALSEAPPIAGSLSMRRAPSGVASPFVYVAITGVSPVFASAYPCFTSRVTLKRAGSRRPAFTSGIASDGRTLTSPSFSPDRKVAVSRPLPRRTSTAYLPSGPALRDTVSPVMRVTVCVLVAPVPVPVPLRTGVDSGAVTCDPEPAAAGVIAPASSPAAPATAQKAWCLRMGGILP
ncbi:hypothetical protein [Streptomyces sp. Root1310]|uniref:hypothetical protein n=1 Tax=Streptomyces sp. Root1310 TaxID=1736452 RepID=UPI001F5B1A96|nr:hypothetical protein [Streptomyces sp. Root1310]